MTASISLSILEYEPELANQIGRLSESEAFLKISRLVGSSKLNSIHIDVMRPPLIPRKFAFPTVLIRQLYEEFHKKVTFAIHLMTRDPDPVIEEVNRFIDVKEKPKIPVILHREIYSSEEEAVEALRSVKNLGYRAGIGLNLPTPVESLTKKIVENIDLVLLMSVRMGRGGQKYHPEATEKIRRFSKDFPRVKIWVDGGIRGKTIRSIIDAGADVLVIGSCITRSKDPIKAFHRLEEIINGL